MWLLSGGSVNRENEFWIVWELPLARALSYYHCALRASLVWTVKPSADAQTKLDKLLELVQVQVSEGEEDD